jgi:iron complex outermembrane receptor protein
MTLQHARFVTYLDGPLNYAGNAQLRSPDFSGNYSAEYAVGLPGNSQLVLRGDYSYESKQFFDAANSTTAGSYQPGYGLANARITYVPARGDWSVALWAKNLGNTHYYQNVLILAPTGLAVAGEPLTFGGSFKFSFN